jgi:membrane protein implicated in regulation of membrane protease activity
MNARVVEWDNGHGRVHADGEVWAAKGPAGLSVGDDVTITARDHLTLTVVQKQG